MRINIIKPYSTKTAIVANRANAAHRRIRVLFEQRHILTVHQITPNKSTKWISSHIETVISDDLANKSAVIKPVFRLRKNGQNTQYKEAPPSQDANKKLLSGEGSNFLGCGTLIYIKIKTAAAINNNSTGLIDLMSLNKMGKE